MGRRRVRRGRYLRTVRERQRTANLRAHGPEAPRAGLAAQPWALLIRNFTIDGPGLGRRGRTMAPGCVRHPRPQHAAIPAAQPRERCQYRTCHNRVVRQPRRAAGGRVEPWRVLLRPSGASVGRVRRANNWECGRKPGSKGEKPRRGPRRGTGGFARPPPAGLQGVTIPPCRACVHREIPHTRPTPQLSRKLAARSQKNARPGRPPPTQAAEPGAATGNNRGPTAILLVRDRAQRGTRAPRRGTPRSRAQCCVRALRLHAAAPRAADPAPLPPPQMALGLGLLPDLAPADVAALEAAEAPNPAKALAQLEHAIELKVRTARLHPQPATCTPPPCAQLHCCLHTQPAARWRSAHSLCISNHSPPPRAAAGRRDPGAPRQRAGGGPARGPRAPAPGRVKRG